MSLMIFLRLVFNLNGICQVKSARRHIGLLLANAIITYIYFPQYALALVWNNQYRMSQKSRIVSTIAYETASRPDAQLWFQIFGTPCRPIYSEMSQFRRRSINYKWKLANLSSFFQPFDIRREFLIILFKCYLDCSWEKTTWQPSISAKICQKHFLRAYSIQQINNLVANMIALIICSIAVLFAVESSVSLLDMRLIWKCLPK